MSIKLGYIKILTLIALAISFVRMTYYSEVRVEYLLLAALSTLCLILFYFPTKVNYPGRVTNQNKEKVYPIAQSLLVQIAFLLSLMTSVLSFQLYTTVSLLILSGLILLVVTKSFVSMRRYLD